MLIVLAGDPVSSVIDATGPSHRSFEGLVDFERRPRRLRFLRILERKESYCILISRASLFLRRCYLQLSSYALDTFV